MTSDRAILTARLQDVDCAGMVKPGFEIDEWLGDPCHHLLCDSPRDIVLLEQVDEGVYSLHWLLASRGKLALAVAERLLRRAFTDLDADLVMGLTPFHLRATRWFNRKIGGQSQGVIETEWGPQEAFTMTREQFEARHGFFNW